MLRSILILSLVCLSFFGLSQEVNYNDWAKEIENDQLTVYTKDSTGSLKRFGAKFKVNGSLQDVLALLRAVDDYEHWISGIHDCQLRGEKLEDKYSYQFYVNKKILFGLYEIKKDGIVKSTVTTSDKAVVIESNIDREAPIDSNYDRIEHYQVRWTLMEKPTYVEVFYEGVVDVQLNFAYALIKPTILDNLEGTFSNMQRIIANELSFK